VLVGTSVSVMGTVDQVSDGVRSAVLKIRVLNTDSRETLARMKATVGFTDGGRVENPAHG
jgi:hypothetical protein